MRYLPFRAAAEGLEGIETCRAAQQVLADDDPPGPAAVGTGREMLFHVACPPTPPAVCRKLVMSRNGGAPNSRLYSRLNCEGLS